MMEPRIGLVSRLRLRGIERRKGVDPDSLSAVVVSDMPI
jgi:hypothetical protein